MPRFPSGPLRLLTWLKYVLMPRTIGAYADAGPVNGKVPPTRIVLAVMPVSLELPSAPGTVSVRAATNATAHPMSFRTDLLLLLTEWPACRRERNSADRALPGATR